MCIRDQKLKAGPLPAAEAVDYIMQVLDALDYAHARGVVHRDIQPGNMMLTPAGELAQPVRPGSHRGAWMSLGAVVAVLAIVAMVAIAPWKKTGAAPGKLP